MDIGHRVCDFNGLWMTMNARGNAAGKGKHPCGVDQLKVWEQLTDNLAARKMPSLGELLVECLSCVGLRPAQDSVAGRSINNLGETGSRFEMSIKWLRADVRVWMPAPEGGAVPDDLFLERLAGLNSNAVVQASPSCGRWGAARV